ncbi:unnamed protein product [Lactuca virosa]|uniref:Uncharacterized protein n=1 Tax=Lactuca virosa TaxID=75947 RepID=A0AAU9NPC0_9ASTR|nr:unnamed protein product [Lactuca virosa]CAH1439554.1 unnamed protein product [Lactuca virosa]
MKLNPKPELMLLINKDFGEPGFFWRTGENIYVKGRTSPGVKELDFCKRKLVLPEEKPKPKAIGEYAFFCSRSFNYYVAIKPESWADHPQTQYQRHAFFPDTLDTSRKYSFFSSSMWYFPHECVDINQIDD